MGPVLLPTLTLLVACGGKPPPACLPDPAPASTSSPRNVVLILMDDVGVDKVGAYGVHPQAPSTPRLDALAAQGLRFTSAYSEPLCSPARAALLTGRRPYRTGIGSNVENGSYDLPDEEVLIPEALSELSGGTWSTMAVGKWHLARQVPRSATAPQGQGFDHFDGILANPVITMRPDAIEGSYWYWEHAVDGELSFSKDYLLTAQADAAIAAVDTLPEPYFLYVALSGPHPPYHVPPEELWTDADPIDRLGMGDALMEATDHEIGRIVDAIAGRATVIVMGDNGTAPELVRAPADPLRGKHTVYGGGTHVPLLIVDDELGSGVIDSLVHVTDLFPTVLDLGGLDAADLGLELDGTSLLPLALEGAPERRCLVSEFFKPNGTEGLEDLAIHDQGWTLVRNRGKGDELYVRDPLAAVEGPDLLKEGEMTDASRDAVRRLRKWLRYDR